MSIGQGFLRTEGKIITHANGDTMLLRGMGLGGWMVQEGYMLQTASFANPQHKIREVIEELIGTTDTDLFYDQWLANHVRKADIDSLKSWGFNSVRLPMHYNLYTLPIEDEPIPGQHTWLDKGFVLTDSLISWCKQNDMYVILDLHAAPGGQGMDEGISDYDNTKPSLWESRRNEEKTVALWRRLAERYANETNVAGYDLLNEVNWNLNGNVALWELYFEITQTIREVDENHIIFIEGNWFANDFTGLTPPWDDNMVYSPHKYWSVNDQASIQWVLNLRDNFNVPLYLGESGENSNMWFRDAITLLEKNNIGWAWWPMKKIQSIAGPLSAIKTPEYQTLLDYWSNGGTRPTAAFAKQALMEITENLKIENCIYQKDVIDAMFRQVNTDETIPFNAHHIPGVIQATDFDMGPVNHAYFDTEVANYQVTTGTFTSWNTGWSYRNDGVDIEAISDGINTNGYGIGWMDVGEWMQYECNNIESGLYDIHVRVASPSSAGRFHFSMDDAEITPIAIATSSGGWDSWKTIVVEDVVIDESDRYLKFHNDQAGFNLNSFEFIKVGESNEVDAEFISGITVDKHAVQINFNKMLEINSSISLSDYELNVSGSNVAITDVYIGLNQRTITLKTDATLLSTDQIRATYSGNSLSATDGTTVNPFFLKFIFNNLSFSHGIPGRVEAESFLSQNGMVLENTTDIGGGQNIGFLDIGDYAEYAVLIARSGLYEVTFRHASQSSIGGLKLTLIDDFGQESQIVATTFNPTGDWQAWSDTKRTVELPEGQYRLRMDITQSMFNLNHIDFELLSSTNEISENANARVYPNPTHEHLNISFDHQHTARFDQLTIYSIHGVMLSKHNLQVSDDHITIDLFNLKPGRYFIRFEGREEMIVRTFVKL